MDLKNMNTKKGVISSSNFMQNSQVIIPLFHSSPLSIRKHELNRGKISDILSKVLRRYYYLWQNKIVMLSYGEVVSGC